MIYLRANESSDDSGKESELVRSHGFLKPNRATRLAAQQQAQQPEVQEVLGREGRRSLSKNLMLQKLERERREQEARRAASQPVQSEVPPEPAGSALATPVGTAVLLPTPAGSAVAGTAESPLEPGRRKQVPTAGETILDLSDE